MLSIEKVKSEPLKRWLCCCVCGVLLLGEGCVGLSFQRPVPAAESGTDAAMRAALNKAGDDFQAGRYEQAADRFSDVYNKALVPAQRRAALYGLACAKLVSAGNPDAYEDALSLWRSWLESAGHQLADEDPQFLDPLVQKQRPRFKMDLTDASAGAIQKDDRIPRWLFIEALQEAETLRNRLTAAEKKIDQLEVYQKKIKSLEKKIRTLKNQIKALESIDEKIQKKKSAIPSAD